MRAVERGEGEIASTGALASRPARTPAARARTSSPCATPTTEKAVWWDNNKADDARAFRRCCWADFRDHAESRELFVQDLYAGADPAHRLNARIFTEYAWHALFIRHLLRRPTAERARRLRCPNSPSSTCRASRPIPNAARRAHRDGDRLQLRQTPGADRRHLLCRRDQEVGLHLSQLRAARKRRDADALLGQRRRRRRHRRSSSASPAPARRRCPPIPSARCSAMTSTAGRTTASSISRAAATPRPSAVAGGRARDLGRHQPLRHRARERHPRSDDARARLRRRSLTENTRSAYPLDSSPMPATTGTRRAPQERRHADGRRLRRHAADRAAHPQPGHVPFPVGLHGQGRRHRERRGQEPQATFSTCFGAPFMPRHPSVYGNLLRELIATHNVDCWLVNTGWTGGKFGAGQRMPIKATRALLDAALSGELKHQPMRTRPAVRLPGADRACRRRRQHPQPARHLGRQARLRQQARSWSTCSTRTSPSSRTRSTPT